MKAKIHVNQLGYISRLGKKASFTGQSSGFEIIDSETRKTMYAGRLGKRLYDEASGDSVSTADFSSFSREGRYYIKIGRKNSCEFEIKGRPYSEFRKAMVKAFYYNRCCATDEDYAGDYAHGECHTAPAAVFGKSGVRVDVSGGWHDSGSYGKYTTTACTALGRMLYAFRLFPSAFEEKGNVPDSPDELPDILAECRCELEWLLKMQTRSGGVYHKVCTLEVTDFVVPDEDTALQYVFGCTHHATALFVAVTALASGIYEKYDRDFSDMLQSAAFSGWVWLSNHPDYVPFKNPPQVKFSTSGDIDAESYDDVLFWTVCELYSMTGEDIFREKINQMYKKVCLTGFSCTSPGGFGALAYTLCRHKTDMEVERSIRLQYRIEADNLMALAGKSGYETALSPDNYRIGSNITIMINAMVLINAYIIHKCSSYLEIAQEQLNYILGKNPVGISYVTGFGTEYAKNPHHRMSAFDDVDEAVPGMVVIGPNSKSDDDYAKWNIPKGTPPAKCYCDNNFCYSTNETSVGCCSAALFVTAFFDTFEE
ncbi:MAG: glycoside hydrolase family 9 protein [Oscillospiraceae bacterium]|nr:glycoside hydrolase family 9 protein [Oscillospiraceae bacterium]